MRPPAWLLRHLWLLTLALTLLNLAGWHRRAAELVRAGRATNDERRALMVRLAIGAALFCGALQLIVWITGESRPECLAAFPPVTPASIASTIATVLLWVALLGWVWVGAGADLLAKLAPAVRAGSALARHYTPAGVRRGVTIFVAIAILAGLVAGLVVRTPAGCALPV
jgi:hypothetical protein